jgi:hypothetical protein
VIVVRKKLGPKETQSIEIFLGEIRHVLVRFTMATSRRNLIVIPKANVEQYIRVFTHSREQSPMINLSAERQVMLNYVQELCLNIVFERILDTAGKKSMLFHWNNLNICKGGKVMLSDVFDVLCPSLPVVVIKLLRSQIINNDVDGGVEWNIFEKPMTGIYCILEHTDVWVRWN